MYTLCVTSGSDDGRCAWRCYYITADREVIRRGTTPWKPVRSTAGRRKKPQEHRETRAGRSRYFRRNSTRSSRADANASQTSTRNEGYGDVWAPWIFRRDRLIRPGRNDDRASASGRSGQNWPDGVGVSVLSRGSVVFSTTVWTDAYALPVRHGPLKTPLGLLSYFRHHGGIEKIMDVTNVWQRHIILPMSTHMSTCNFIFKTVFFNNQYYYSYFIWIKNNIVNEENTTVTVLKVRKYVITYYFIYLHAPSDIYIYKHNQFDHSVE